MLLECQCWAVLCRTRLSPQLSAVCAEFAEHLHDEWAMIKVRTLYEYMFVLVSRVVDIPLNGRVT